MYLFCRFSIQECVHNNIVYQNGESFPIDDCNFCTCDQNQPTNCGSAECRKFIKSYLFINILFYHDLNTS